MVDFSLVTDGDSLMPIRCRSLQIPFPESQAMFEVNVLIGILL
jgi:hypothetical protein